ncbi:MAG: hypothetical protein EBU85_03250, partial [Actinobacteria bacterium]|nr:hypothetical protein [Actinomycetota bacterium]
MRSFRSRPAVALAAVVGLVGALGLGQPASAVVAARAKAPTEATRVESSQSPGLKSVRTLTPAATKSKCTTSNPRLAKLDPNCNPALRSGSANTVTRTAPTGTGPIVKLPKAPTYRDFSQLQSSIANLASRLNSVERQVAAGSQTIIGGGNTGGNGDGGTGLLDQLATFQSQITVLGGLLDNAQSQLNTKASIDDIAGLVADAIAAAGIPESVQSALDDLTAQLADKADASALDDYLTTADAESTYATLTSLDDY